MGISSSQLQPQELVTFKKLPTSVLLENIEIPETAENRRPTNVKWLVVLGITIIILLPFMIYTLCYADIQRILVGTDKCGNVCGKNNSHWDGIPCSGKDYTNSPYLEYERDFRGGLDIDSIDIKERQCVNKCRDGYVAIFGRCYKERRGDYALDAYPGHDVTAQRIEEEIDLGAYFAGVKWQIIISCLLSILVAMGMLFLFRHAVAFVVWGILLGCFFALLIIVCVFWYFYIATPESSSDYDRKENPKQVFLIMGITFTIVAVVVAIVLFWCRKKVRLVILLLKEATKAVFDMPGLMTIPVLCVFAILFLTALFAVTTAFMSSAGILQLVHTSGNYEASSNKVYDFVHNPVMIFTMAYNVVVYIWLSQFFTGIQYMIIAGAVSKWYFSRDKSFLGSPILTSVSIAFKFHLGTVALGSLIITIMAIIKSIILSLIKNEKVRVFVQACIEAIENFFKFLSKNAYIITAMHGQAFLKSGKRAAKLLIQNLGDVIAVNYIGDFILGMAQLLIVVVTILLSMGILNIAPGPAQASNIPAYVLVGIVALVVACVCFGVFETTIDTLFICYCEDNLLNDGMARPYFMSRNLMEFVQESKEVYGKKR